MNQPIFKDSENYSGDDTWLHSNVVFLFKSEGKSG